MPDTFVFEATDPIVVKRLTREEIEGVEQWQSDRCDYQFEFHTGHEAAWPIYMREKSGRYQLTKINLQEDPEHFDGVSIQNNLMHAENLADFEDVVANNAVVLRKMAKAFYDGVEVEDVASLTRYVRFTCCSKRPWRGQHYVRMPLRSNGLSASFWNNAKNYAQIPNCGQHRSSACMVGEVVQLGPGADAASAKEYDANMQFED